MFLRLYLTVDVSVLVIFFGRSPYLFARMNCLMGGILFSYADSGANPSPPVFIPGLPAPHLPSPSLPSPRLPPVSLPPLS